MLEETGEIIMEPPAPPPVPHFPKIESYSTAPKPTFQPIRIHFAINRFDEDKVKALIEKGIDCNFATFGNTPLILAMRRRMFGVAHMLVEDGNADVNKPEPAPWRRLPIHIACDIGDLDTVQLLVKHGASVHSTDLLDFTPLHWASYQGHLEVVKYLIEKGAHVNVRDDIRRTPLARAAERGHAEIVDYLHEEGATVNTYDKYGWNPLFEQVICGRMNLMNDLLEMGVDVNCVDFAGNSLLHIAINRLQEHVICTMSECTPDPTKRGKLRATKNFQEAYTVLNVVPTTLIVMKLLDYQIRASIVNNEGCSPLKLAAERGDVDVMGLLINAGVSLSREQWILDCDWPVGILRYPDLCQSLQVSAHDPMRKLVELSRLRIRGSVYRPVSKHLPGLPLPERLLDYLQISMETL